MSEAEGGDFTRAEDPVALFTAWLAEATRTELNDPNAMALATVDSAGLPDVRMVLLKGVGPDGFVFYSNAESAKGEQMAANPKAAFVFHWKSLGRQVRGRGRIEVVGEDEADAYFRTRPRDSQLGAWASRQSRPLESRRALEQAVAARALQYPDMVPRPPYWKGFRLAPVSLEFWQNQPFRLHDRVVFRRRSPDGPWSRECLYP